MVVVDVTTLEIVVVVAPPDPADPADPPKPPGVNLNNILRAAFMRTDPKSEKRY